MHERQAQSAYINHAIHERQAQSAYINHAMHERQAQNAYLNHAMHERQAQNAVLQIGKFQLAGNFSNVTSRGSDGTIFVVCYYRLTYWIIRLAKHLF